MSLTDPFWLILAIPLAMLFWRWQLPSRLLLLLRAVALAAAILALCGLCVVLPLRSGTVVVVADRSLSMPADSQRLQLEAVRLLQTSMPADDKLGVVSFAESAAVEQSPQRGELNSFSGVVGQDASQLADALDLALSMIGKGESGRLLVLSDGQWTGRDISASAARAAAAGVGVDYRAIERSAADDLAIQRVDVPDSVLAGESFMIAAWIDSPRGQTVGYELLRGGRTIAQGKAAVPTGSSRLLFRDTASAGGVCQYVLRVEGGGKDPVPENNRARFLVGVRGNRPLLCVSPTKSSSLPRLLVAAGLKVEARTPPECGWTLEELGGFSGVLLENTPGGAIGHVGMRNLAAWIAQAGGGLMLTGGRDGYGSGGYYKSPLDPLLPVSMELRREHRKLSLAIVVALDRSGSMACPASDGRPKIQLADLATAEVVNMLGPTDQFGCIAVDVVPHVIVPVSDVLDKAGMCRKILRIDSSGGGIYIHEALETAGAMVASAKAGVRHIVLFADAADSRQHPGEYPRLVANCVKAGITVSVIGLGSERDCDADILKDIARRAGGQCMFTSVAQELPRLFAQDTCVIARSSFIDEPTAVKPTGGLKSITPQPLPGFPSIGGYNLCYFKPGSSLGLVSADENHAPVLAAWQAGSGRVLCYTGEADGKYTGAMAGWGEVGNFFSSLARWTAGKSQGLGPGVVATQELRSGVCRVELHLDPGRDNAPFTRLPELTALCARPGEAAVPKKTRLNWASPDVLLAELPLVGSETILPTIDIPGVGQATLAPTCMPYSPEFLPRKPGQGAAALEGLAKATGGCERVNLPEIWKQVPRKPQNVPLSPYLLLLAAGIFLTEVLQRRTGVFSADWRRLARLQGMAGWLRRGAVFKFGRRKAGAKAAPQGSSETDTDRAAADRPLQNKPEPSRAPPPAPKLAPAAKSTPAQTAKPAEPPADGMGDALSQAQQRARRRTERK